MHTDADRSRLHRCLEAVATEELFDDHEFHTLFGLERADVRAILAMWPRLDDSDPKVVLAVTNCLVNLIGYPHGRDLTSLVGATSLELQDVLSRWRTHTWHRLPIHRRIAVARENSGLTHADVAARLSISIPACWDLETHNDEAVTCLSLRQLITLAELLSVGVLELVDEDPTVPVLRQLLPQEIAVQLRQRLVDHQLDVDALGDQLGWELADVLHNPDSVWEQWTVCTLRDVCGPLALDWRAVLLPSNPSHVHEK